MRKLFFNILLLFFLVIATIVGVLVWNPYEKDDIKTAYLASAIDKYHRLDSLKSPKIVLLAGSNFAYGINSQMIEKQLKMPVVNLAIHYNLGTRFMLKSVENKLNAGDILLTGFEYIIERDGNIKDQIELAHFLPEANNWVVYANDKQKITENIFYYIFKFRVIVRRLFNTAPIKPSIENTTDIFFRNGFNQYGDLISHLNNPPIHPLPSMSALEFYFYNKQHIVDEVNKYNKKIERKGAKLYFTYPTYALSAFNKDKKVITQIKNQYDSLANFTILGNPTTFVYPDSLYQDMVYHLNAKGRNIRTQDLINLLKTAEKK